MQLLGKYHSGAVNVLEKFPQGNCAQCFQDRNLRLVSHRFEKHPISHLMLFWGITVLLVWSEYRACFTLFCLDEQLGSLR